MHHYIADDVGGLH